MIECEHLQVYDLELTTRSPLYVGSGRKYAQTEYTYDARSKRVRILDQNRFLRYLLENGLADDYEAYVLSGKRQIFSFLKTECRLSDSVINELCRYSLHAEDALDEDHSLKEIHQFCRGADDRAYIPGSSVKGALRTVLLTQMLLDEEQRRGQWPTDTRKDRSAKQMQQLEAAYLNTLGLNQKKRDDAVNDILRGISVSDSLPIPDADMILVGKEDMNIEGETQSLNLCRECVRPGTKLRFRLTLDQSILKGKIDAERLRYVLSLFDWYYQNTYVNSFRGNAHEADLSQISEYLVLGGGAGFFSKTLAYPYLGEKDGLKWVSDELTRQFPDRDNRHHSHQNDPEKGISPHMLKYGRYQGKLYPYGICEVKIS